MESLDEPLASHPRFAARLLFNFLIASVIILLSLVIGMWGYHDLVGLGWVDSFLEASMILSGMGPVGIISTVEGKVFAGFYALYSGLVLVLTAGIIIAPIAHRILHRLNVVCD